MMDRWEAAMVSCNKERNRYYYGGKDLWRGLLKRKQGKIYWTGRSIVFLMAVVHRQGKCITTIMRGGSARGEELVEAGDGVLE